MMEVVLKNGRGSLKVLKHFGGTENLREYK